MDCSTSTKFVERLLKGLTGKTEAHQACNRRRHEHSDNVAVCCMQIQLGLLQG